MGKAKEIVLKVIPASIANPFIRAHHYSGGVVTNSCLHFGVFLDGQLHGVMSYGPSMNKQKMIGLVEGTGWNEFLELNRMAFDAVLPRNSESRALSISLRLIRKYAPQVKWVLSFADACSCGDGTIYRAANFVLTGMKRNEALCILPDAGNPDGGTRMHKMVLSANPTTPRPELGGKCYFDVTGGRFAWKEFLQKTGAKLLDGWQLRYIYFIDPSYRQRLTVPEIPFSRIDEMGAGMYKGEKVTLAARHSGKPARGEANSKPLANPGGNRRCDTILRAPTFLRKSWNYGNYSKCARCRWKRRSSKRSCASANGMNTGTETSTSASPAARIPPCCFTSRAACTRRFQRYFRTQDWNSQKSANSSGQRPT